MFLCLNFSDPNLVMCSVSNACGLPELILVGKFEF